MGFFSKLLGKEEEGNKALREAMQMIWKIVDDEKFIRDILADFLGMEEIGRAHV